MNQFTKKEFLKKELLKEDLIYKNVLNKDSTQEVADFYKTSPFLHL